MRLILASTSPRRKEILSCLGLPFEIDSPDLQEVFRPNRRPAEEAAHWAAEKARTVHRRHPDALVLGSDTVIDFDGQPIGKPKNEKDAVRILESLAGRSHTVVTAVAAVHPDGTDRVRLVSTRVTMREAESADLLRYVRTGEPLDKAGAYSLQGEGRRLIRSIEGDFLAAVGLPLRAVEELLREAGIRPAADVDSIYRERRIMNWKSYGA